MLIYRVTFQLLVVREPTTNIYIYLKCHSISLTPSELKKKESFSINNNYVTMIVILWLFHNCCVPTYPKIVTGT